MCNPSTDGISKRIEEVFNHIEPVLTPQILRQILSDRIDPIKSPYRQPLLMTLSLGLRALEASKITICPTNVQITSILTLIFNISVVYGQIGLCFGDDTPVGLCYHISWAHDPTKRFRGP